MKRTWQSSEFRLGILGGGQLGRMFIQEAINYNIKVDILDPDENAPCSKIADSFTVGELNDYITVLAFGSNKDVITVEIENINIDALKKLEEEGKKIYPQPRVLELIKDKGLQKQFYLDNDLPTAEFILLNNKNELYESKSFLPAVQKLRTGGYDGKGVQVLRNESDMEKGFEAPSVLEKMIPFSKEISVIVSRNESGQTAVYPSVECEFNPDANLVEFLFSPAEISKEIEQKAENIALSVIEKLNMVGILAVEFFLLFDGTLLINEIAPRPHNSGHHTIECNVTSQFEQHLRSILNLPPGSTKMILPGVMINLLGENGHKGKAHYQNLDTFLQSEGFHVHLYGKANTKPFRKMGHITIAHESIELAKKLAKKALEEIKVVSEN